MQSHTRTGLNLPRKSVKANGSKCSSFLSAMCFPFAKLSKHCSVGTKGILSRLTNEEKLQLNKIKLINEKETKKRAMRNLCIFFLF